MLSRILIVFFVFFCLSCNGYRAGTGSSLSAYRTISVPYVAGDWNGDLTAAIIREVTQSGVLVYSHAGALTLRVKVLDYEDENIGFRYDRNKRDEFSSRIVPDETRTWIITEVAILETVSGKVILGPVRLAAEVEYDHDYYSSSNGVNEFSLGQFTDVEEAEDAAEEPLNRNMAKKIVDYIEANYL